MLTQIVLLEEIMKKKGRVQAGCDADLVAFDPATIEDKATFVAPAQTSVGFRHVVVNGTPIIEDQAPQFGETGTPRPEAGLTWAGHRRLSALGQKRTFAGAVRNVR